MLDEPEETGGKINWPVAIVISLIIHIVALGLFWTCSGSKEAPAPEDGKQPVPAVTEPAVAEPAKVEPDKPVQPATAPVVDDKANSKPKPVAPPVALPVKQVNPPNPPAVNTKPASSEQPRPVEETAEYVVKSGDYLSRIANKCKCTVADLKRLNPGVEKRVLQPGDKLKVPAK